MKQGVANDHEPSSAFFKATQQCLGSYEVWKPDFVGIGKMRGVGWVICYQDPAAADAFQRYTHCSARPYQTHG